MVGGADDDAMSKRLLARSSKKAVDVLLLKRIVVGVQLALDRVKFARAGSLCYQIDANITPVYTLKSGPVGIVSDITIEIPVGCLVSHVAKDQFLKVGALFTLTVGTPTIRVE